MNHEERIVCIEQKSPYTTIQPLSYGGVKEMLPEFEDEYEGRSVLPWTPTEKTVMVYD